MVRVESEAQEKRFSVMQEPEPSFTLTNKAVIYISFLKRTRSLELPWGGVGYGGVHRLPCGRTYWKMVVQSPTRSKMVFPFVTEQ